MGRWRAGTAGLALVVWTAWGCSLGGNVTPEPAPEPPVEDPVPDDRPGIPQRISGDARWTVHTRASGRQDAVAVVPDGNGGTVLLGTSESSSPGVALTLTRHDGEGQAFWSRSFTVTPRQGGLALTSAQQLAVSPAGDIFIAAKVQGEMNLAGTVIADGGFVMKLSAEGSPLWVRAVGTPRALGTNAAGELLVAHGFLVERYDANGTSLGSWEATAMASASAVAMDAEGGVVLAGQKPVAPFESRGFIVRLSPDGDVRWQLEVGPDAPLFTDVTFRPDGSILLGGDFNGTLEWGSETLRTPCYRRGCFRTVFALAADAYGSPLWGRVLDSEELSGSEEPRLAVNARGDAAVVWRHGCGSELASLSPAGDILWQNLYVSYPCSANTLLRDVTFLGDGDVVGAGMFLGTRAFGDSQPYTAEDADVFLQRMVP